MVMHIVFAMNYINRTKEGIETWGKGENSLCRHIDKVTAKSRLISLPKGFGVKG
jgi:hypothetical protein